MIRVMRLPKVALASEVLALLPDLVQSQPPHGLMSEAQGLLARVEDDGDFVNFYTSYSGSIVTVPCIAGNPQFTPQLALAERNFRARRELWLNCPVDISPYTSFLNLLLHNPQYVLVVESREVVILPVLDQVSYDQAVIHERKRAANLAAAAAAAKARVMSPEQTHHFHPGLLIFLALLLFCLGALFTSSFWSGSPYYHWMQELWHKYTQPIDKEQVLKDLNSLEKIVDLRLELAYKMRDHNLIQTGAFLQHVHQDAWDRLRRLRLERDMAQLQSEYQKSQQALASLKADLEQANKKNALAQAEAAKAQAEAEKSKEAAALAKKEAAEAQARAEVAGAAAAEIAEAEHKARLEAEAAQAAARASADAAAKAEKARLAAEAAARAEAAAAKEAKAQAAEQAAAAKKPKLPKCSMVRQQGKMPFMMLATDGSGSMVTSMPDGNDRIDAAIDAASFLIDKTDKNVPIHFFGIQGCPVVKDYGVFGGSQRRALKHVLHKTDPRGDVFYEYIMTPLVSAIQAMGEHAPKNADSVGIILTDGHDTCAPHGTNICSVARQVHAKRPRLKINIVFIGDKDELRSMRCVAQATGGEVYSSQNTTQLVQSLTEAGQSLQKVCEE